MLLNSIMLCRICIIKCTGLGKKWGQDLILANNVSLTHLKKKSELERNDIAIYTYILHLTWKDLEFVALDGL